MNDASSKGARLMISDVYDLPEHINLYLARAPIEQCHEDVKRCQNQCHHFSAIDVQNSAIWRY